MKRLLLVAVAAYLLFLVSQLPASLVYEVSNRFLPELQMQQPDGTFWKGSSEAVTVTGIELGRMEWQARPLAFLLGEWSNAVTLDGPFPGSANIGVGLGDMLSLGDARIRADLADLVSRSNLSAIGITLGGELSASIDHAEFRQQRITTARGLLSLRNLVFPDGRNMGDFTGKLATGEDGVHRFDFRSVNDEALQVEGRLVMMSDDSLELDLLIRNPDYLGRQLAAMYKQYSIQEPEGYRYIWQGDVSMLGFIYK